MNILVIGCGKVGSRLAGELSRLGHVVSVVDKDANSFDLLPDDYTGFTLQGIPIDLDVLRRAGIEGCDAVAAVTQDDNINIMVCQLAREIFKIDTIIARIYDPARKDVFSHFGLTTICPTNMTVSSVVSAITKKADISYVSISSSTIAYSLVSVPKKLIGKTTKDLDYDDDEMIFGVLHEDGRVVLNTERGIVLNETDKIIYAKVID